MITLSFGFKKPTTGDLGPTIFPALEANWQQVNDHNHNGVNSSSISSASIAAVTQNISAANWVASANGLYEQTITMPAAVAYDNITIELRYNNQRVFASVERIGAGIYKVYTNLSTADYVAVYR
jgi:hypothetical protein